MLNKSYFVKYSVLFFLMLYCCACEQGASNTDTTDQENPAADGFDALGSDEEAVALADSVMRAMGGRKAWDETRFISWNFFGRRDLIWDKWSGRVRIEIPADTTIFLVNVNDETGRVSIKGKELEDPDSLNMYIQRAKQIWVNDSYWLVMPFKLKDSGVTLKYIGEEAVEAGLIYKVLELTFENIGFTPNNKYRVYIDAKDNLIKQWAFYQQSTQEEPTAVWPWDNYQQHGGILLSADRSDGRGPKNVRIDGHLNDRIFDHF